MYGSKTGKIVKELFHMHCKSSCPHFSFFPQTHTSVSCSSSTSKQINGTKNIHCSKSSSFASISSNFFSSCSSFDSTISHLEKSLPMACISTSTTELADISTNVIDKSCGYSFPQNYPCSSRSSKMSSNTSNFSSDFTTVLFASSSSSLCNYMVSSIPTIYPLCASSSLSSNELSSSFRFSNAYNNNTLDTLNFYNNNNNACINTSAYLQNNNNNANNNTYVNNNNQIDKIFHSINKMNSVLSYNNLKNRQNTSCNFGEKNVQFFSSVSVQPPQDTIGGGAGEKEAQQYVGGLDVQQFVREEGMCGGIEGGGERNLINKNNNFVHLNEREGIQNLLASIMKEDGVECLEKILNIFTSPALIRNKIRTDDFLNIFQKINENIHFINLSDIRFAYIINSLNEEGIMEYADKQQILIFMKYFEIFGLRNALRDSATFLYRSLENASVSTPISTSFPVTDSSSFPHAVSLQENDVSIAVEGLSILGNSFIFYANLFEFCNANLTKMNTKALSTYIYECGRHGLRCKHYLDNSLNMCCMNSEKMSLSEMMQCANGFIRFAREYSKFYVGILSHITKHVNELSVSDCHLVLRFCKENRTHQNFCMLQNSVAGYLSDIIHSLNIAQACRCLSYLEYHPNSKEKTKALVHKILHKMNNANDLTESLTVNDVVDAIDCFASWDLRTILLNKLGDILVNRISEVKFSSNISLWLIAFDGFAKAGWYHLSYLNAACAIARDDYMLDRLSIFQQGRFVCCLARLHHYEYDIYNNIADRLAKEFHLFKNVREISSILNCYANANHINLPLFNAAYQVVIQLIDSQTLDLSKVSIANSIISLCWSFVVAHFHTHETFPSILDYAFFNKDANNRFGFKRLHQIADACFLENNEIANKCQYREVMESYTTHENCKIIRHVALNIKHDKDADILKSKVVEEFSDILNQLGVHYDLSDNMDKYSPYVVEIRILSDQKNFEKLGFFIQGRDVLMRTGNEGKWVYTNTGCTALMERTLKLRGWNLGRLSLSEWLSMRTLDDKREFVINKFSQIGFDIPFATF